jgi:hypothetical protein
MDDATFAAELLARLQRLAGAHPHIARDILMVIERRSPCSLESVGRPGLMTCTTHALPGMAPLNALGLLGILNGLLGPTSPDSIVVVKTAAGDFERFSRLSEELARKPEGAAAAGHWRCEVCWQDIPETPAHRNVHPLACAPAFGLA